MRATKQFIVHFHWQSLISKANIASLSKPNLVASMTLSFPPHTFALYVCLFFILVFLVVHAALDYLLRVFCTPIFYWSWWCKWNVFWVGLITSLCVIQNPFISLIMIMVNWHCMCKCSGRELTIGLLYLMYFEFNRWCWRSLLMCNLLERLTRKMKEWSFGMRLLSV